MGCGSSSSGKNAGQGRSRDAAKRRSLARGGQALSVRVVLLGASEAGKSTVFKQMRAIHMHGWSNEERTALTPLVWTHTISAMKAVAAAAERMGVDWRQASEDAAVLLEDVKSTSPMSSDIAVAIKTLWSDPAIRVAFKRSSEYQLVDGVAHFFDSIERISAGGYVPTEQDILLARDPTTSAKEISFDAKGIHFTFVDTSGDRAERRHWPDLLATANAVVFVVGISEYDQVMREDESTNRLIEALLLFREVVQSPVLADVPVILFLNKVDVFGDKLGRVDLSTCFASYTGGRDFGAASKFIEREFVKQAGRPIFPHLVCAIDTKGMRAAFQSIVDAVQARNLPSRPA